MPSDINLNKIMNYSEWLSHNTAIPIKNRLDAYDDYLKGKLIDDVIIADKEEYDRLKNMYLTFMKRIATIYKNDDSVIRLDDINFDNKDELISAIPIIASKIRDIALFYKEKRKYLSTKRADISIRGSIIGFELQMNNLFMGKYSNNDRYQDPTIDDDKVLLEIPSQEELKGSFNIKTIELYNTHSQIPKND